MKLHRKIDSYFENQSFDLGDIFGAGKNETVTLGGIDFNIPAGYKEDSSNTFNIVEGFVADGYNFDGKVYAKDNTQVGIFVYSFAESTQGLRVSRASGIIGAGEVIELSADSADAEIYYTTDGREPDPKAEEGTFLYNPEEGIRINRDVTIKAVAVQKGKSSSDVLTVAYSVSDIPAQVEKMEAEAAEAENGLQELTAEQLEDRWNVDGNFTNTKQIEIRDVFGDMLVRGSNLVLTKDMKLTSKEIAISGEAEKKVKHLLGNEYQFISNYEIFLYKDGNKVQPEKQVTVGISIPDEYADADVMIVSSNEKGQITVYETRRDNGYVYADMDYIRCLGLVGADFDEDADSRVDLIKILTAGAAVLAGIGIVLIAKNRRKKRYIEES